jgi:hypothetical protein
MELIILPARYTQTKEVCNPVGAGLSFWKFVFIKDSNLSL